MAPRCDSKLRFVTRARVPARVLSIGTDMSEKMQPDQAIPSGESAPDQVPEWLGNRLRRMFNDVMDEPVPDEFKALLRQLEDKERGS